MLCDMRLYGRVEKNNSRRGICRKTEIRVIDDIVPFVNIVSMALLCKELLSKM